MLCGTEMIARLSDAMLASPAVYKAPHVSLYRELPVQDLFQTFQPSEHAEESTWY